MCTECNEYWGFCWNCLLSTDGRESYTHGHTKKIPAATYTCRKQKWCAHLCKWNNNFIYRLTGENLHTSIYLMPLSRRGSIHQTILSQFIRGNFETFPGQLRDIISIAFPESAPGPLPSRRCLKHLDWLLSMWSSFWMTELCISTVRESPAALQKKLISPTCVHSLISAQGSWT